MFHDGLRDDAVRLLALCRAKSLRLATAESCTGGLIGALLTEIPGSSDVFDRGFITYSNAAKMTILDVPEAVLATHGAVSAATVEAMVAGTLRHSVADVAVAVSGVAGPGGGSSGKPVGLVYIACGAREGATLTLEKRYGDIGRAHVRMATVIDAVALMANVCGRA
ncbi:MAG: CinA family protein [Hyphomicrobiaceae bacterium]